MENTIISFISLHLTQKQMQVNKQIKKYLSENLFKLSDTSCTNYGQINRLLNEIGINILLIITHEIICYIL